MQLIRGIHNLRPEHRGCVLTIGNFDGVHLGHAAVLAKVQEEARKRGLPTCVMLFEPQPLEFFGHTNAPSRISRLREKYVALNELGIDRLLCVRFNDRFAQQAPETFIRELLVERLGVRYLVVGDDFHFGRARQGDFQALELAGQQFGFEVMSTQSFMLGRQRISSTLVRQALAEGRLAEVELLLGKPFSLSGRVAHGQKLGRTIGFPTANIALKRRVAPLSGVYAVEVVCSNIRFQGVANVGTRPTVAGKEARLEVHLFNFDGDLYGEQLRVLFRHKLREEQKFSSLAQLQTQINLDAEQARNWFAALPSISAATPTYSFDGILDR